MVVLRFVLVLLLLLVAICCTGMSEASEQPSEKPADQWTQVVDYDSLCALARQVADRPAEPRSVLPEVLARMQYDDYRRIAFRPKHAVWWDELPTSLETFHRGFVQRDKVRIFTICDGESKEVMFSKSDFQYQSPLNPDAIPSDAGHAGLKLVSTLDEMSGGQELLTFLGASYFRGRSGATRYGTSARALAIDVAMNREEEFPFFRGFWVVRPKQDQRCVTVLALLDSPSVAGAYKFELTPGMHESQLQVESVLYFRSVPDKVALAPLTSMWIWGDGLDGPPKDARPAVHDSDGLLVQHRNETAAPRHSGQPSRDGASSGETSEWTWRAFARQSYPSVSRIAVDQLIGFGLMQRNRSFYHYDDHNARYDLRPSVWVTTDQPWTDGVIELLELPGAHEGVDNIAAYWIPDCKPTVGEPVKLKYTVSFFAGDYGRQVNVARATHFDVQRDADGQTIDMTIRFSGTPLHKTHLLANMGVDVQLMRASLLRKSMERTESGDLLVGLTFQLDSDAPPELAVQLVEDGKPLSERFTYLCPPQEPEFVYPAVYTRTE
ncbi:glucan biosynthesis protein [Stieleria magnilauensis]|uniref:Glucans biosynthesis protein G n=1 Tax=Stieleria magnilauensis TaxID=2527963 RepID=A0ABX5XSX9_9BACT|nr:Glucans biosynthesis protein G precursor [Planctomycetes bacterium TBK1r]